MRSVREVMFPYGMQKNPDGSWTFFNRNYKPVGNASSEWAAWDDPMYHLTLPRIGKSTLAKLDCKGVGTGERIYFYNDATNPEGSAENMKKYLEKLKILLGLREP